MSLSRNVIQGAAGGLIGGAVLGVAEAGYLAASGGAPDMLAPFYATVLYGAIGLGLGVAGGIALTGFGRVKKLSDAIEPRAFAFGAVSATAPIALFVLMYLVNKEIYAEAGVPMVGKVGILATVGVLAIALMTVGVRLLRGPLGFLLKGPGALGTWGLLALVTGAAAMAPSGDDPRATWAHKKAIPAGLKEKPNVLMITVDTLRADHLGTYGFKGDPTPVIDAIAKDGVVFEQHIAQASWTRSSFASLFSSRIPASHNADKKASRLADEAVLLPEVLQDGGLTTGNLANNINVSSTFNFDQGYDTFIYESPVYPFGATESVFGLTLYKVVHKLNERIGPKLGIGKDVATFYQPAEVVLGDAKGFIEANKDGRWYLGVHLMEPHDPYFEHPYLMGKGADEFNGVGYARAEHESPEKDKAEYLAGVYLDEIKHMDKKLAAFIDWMKKSGLYDDTMIIITADHGEEFAEHGGFWHGTTLYDEQIHIPLIVKLPKNELAGTRVSWQSRAIDVAPTIAAAQGLKAGEGWMGKDLLEEVRAELKSVAAERGKLAEAEKAVADAQAALAAAPDDAALQGALATAQAALTALQGGGDKACVPYKPGRPAISQEDFEGNVISSVRHGGVKLIAAAAGGPRGLPEREVFDIVADPGEKKNVAGGALPCSKTVASLDDELKGAITGAQANATQGGEAKTSGAECQNLRALGYVDPNTKCPGE